MVPTKRGLPWPYDHPASLFSLYTPYKPLTWLFNWELWSPPSLPPNLSWTPQIRLPSSLKDLDPFLTNADHKPQELIGFNEPDHPSQANLPANEAAQLWRSHVLPAKHKFGLRLGSPAVTSDTGKCIPWLDEFFEQLGGVKGAEVDFLVVHWYGRQVGKFKAFLEQMYQRYGVGIWITEFACQGAGDGEEVKRFMKESVKWLEETEWVERYAYFGHGVGGSVGEWVGKGNDFLVRKEGETEGWEGMRVSEVGKLYCEL